MILNYIAWVLGYLAIIVTFIFLTLTICVAWLRRIYERMK